MTICSDWNVRHNVPVGTLEGDYGLLEYLLNVPPGTLERYFWSNNDKTPECSDWNIGHVLHTNSTCTW